MRIQQILIRILDILGAIVGLIGAVLPVSMIAILVKKDGGPIFLNKSVLVRTKNHL